MDAQHVEVAALRVEYRLQTHHRRVGAAVLARAVHQGLGLLGVPHCSVHELHGLLVHLGAQEEVPPVSEHLGLLEAALLLVEAVHVHEREALPVDPRGEHGHACGESAGGGTGASTTYGEAVGPRQERRQPAVGVHQPRHFLLVDAAEESLLAVQAVRER